MEENKLVALIRKLRKGGPQGRSGLGMGMSITRKHDDTLPDNALYRRFVRQGLYDPEKDDYVVHTETKFEGEKLTFDEDDAAIPVAAPASAPSSSLTKSQVKQKLLDALEQAGDKGIKRRKLAETICPGRPAAGLDDLIGSALASLIKQGTAVEDGKRVLAGAKPAAAAGSKRGRSGVAAPAAAPAIGKADKAAKSSKKDKSEKKAAKAEKASKSDKKKKAKQSKQ